MLNQTNIGHNNNKYYVIQLIKDKTSKPPAYWTWNRWGRVASERF
jgi:poly [ADP-ribose] polymerase